ncbi:hypothetical protein D3C80_1544390 [compost metagenome]
MFQWTLLAGLVFQRGDDAGAPSIGHPLGTACHQGEEVVLGLVPEAGDDAAYLEGVEQADGLQAFAETGQ